MEEENDTNAGGARRFRLPKLFAEAEAEAETSDESGARDDAVIAPEKDQSMNVRQATTQRESEANAQANAQANAAQASTGEPSDEQMLEYVSGMAQELLSMRGVLSHLTQQVEEINQRESTQEKVFDTLHTELGDYKKDFIYERLKPIVRPLLFLYDSLEQFDDEVAQHEKPDEQERRGLSPRLVRENVVYFRDQLVEALHVCQVTQMEAPSGIFNAKLHKAMGVENVAEEQHGQILRVLRSGWYLNGQLLRPAEVVVGKSNEAAKASDSASASAS